MCSAVGLDLAATGSSFLMRLVHVTREPREQDDAGQPPRMMGVQSLQTLVEPVHVGNQDRPQDLLDEGELLAIQHKGPIQNASRRCVRREQLAKRLRQPALVLVR